MKLKSWLEAESGRAAKLAKALNVYPSFISKIANGKKPVPFEQCMPIECATEGAVTRRDLRPDDFHIHWPELAVVRIHHAQDATKTVADTQPAIEHRQADEPWDGKTERRKLDAPIDCRVSPESVAHAQFLRSQSAAKQQGV